MQRLVFLALLFGMATSIQGAEAPRKVQYAREIQPILSANCFLCHGPDEKNRKAGLRLDHRELAVKVLKSGTRAIVPGDAKNSELMVRILADDASRMPPHKSQKTLSESEKQLLKRWIDEGAEYQKHWAFLPPEGPTLPAVRRGGWVRNPIDAFILARLEAERLQPAPEADRYTLARRVAIDLTGLPPTIEAVDQFVHDPDPDAYEKYVAHVLASPAFGERWAQVWLDLARYADSNGYAEDQPRTIWRYRDWVIDALNANMPFDRFTMEQLAGDLMAQPTNERLIATAFHRNTLTNTEGGTNDEEFRAVAVVDRVNTTMQVWMGLTLGCAQCHDHKYDPFSQEEYFRLYAIFNQTEDADRPDNSPLLPYPTLEQADRQSGLEARIAGSEKVLKTFTPALVAAQKRWETQARKDTQLPANIKAILALDAERRRPEQQAELTEYFRSIAPELKQRRDQLATLRKQLANVIRDASTPIMRELPEGKRRQTFIHVRGNFLNPGKEVRSGLPAALPPLPGKAPPSRLALARWLVDPANPLTARVAVNRFWEQLFGVGLIETPEDFGIRGKPPTHPDLLDWLATEFIAQQWDIKKLLYLMVTSAAYRQSSAIHHSPSLDPDNRLFSRGPRFRSPAESVRDLTLFTGGLLSHKMHGPPVQPPQPRLGLNAAFGPGTDWETSKGEDKYRRALYTQWRRTTPYPSMVAFDAPGRTVCAVNRPRTNTPLQALVTLNDPVYVEAAQALARRMVLEAGPTAEGIARHGFRLCLSRPPRDSELSRVVDLYRKIRAEYSHKPQDAATLATTPLGPVPAGMDPVELAAWTTVGNVLLNLDEVLAKR